MWNYKCDRCGCALDPGERCDCGEAPADDKEVYTEDTFDYGIPVPDAGPWDALGRRTQPAGNGRLAERS